MSQLTKEIRWMIMILGGVLGMLISVYIKSEVDTYLRYRNSQYVQQYWAELKDLTLYNNAEVSYINPKVFDFFSLTPYFVADLKISKEKLNKDLLQVGWSNKGNYYVKEVNNISLKLSTKIWKERIRIRIDKLD